MSVPAYLCLAASLLAACATLSSQRIDLTVHEADQEALQSIDEKGGTVAVLPFRDSQGHITELGTLLADSAKNDLVAGKRLIPLDRQDICDMLSEIRLGLSGYTEQQDSLQLGRLKHARYLMMGTVTPFGGQYILQTSLLETETGRLAGSSRKTLPASASMDSLFAQRLTGIADCAQALGKPPNARMPADQQPPQPRPPPWQSVPIHSEAVQPRAPVASLRLESGHPFHIESFSTQWHSGPVNAIAADSRGTLHAIYSRTFDPSRPASEPAGLFYTRRLSGHWSAPKLLDGGQITTVAMAVNKKDDVFITYWNDSRRGVGFIRSSGGSFQDPVQLFRQDGGGAGVVAMGLDNNGNPEIAFSTYRDSALYFMEWDGTRWTDAQEITAGAPRSGISLDMAVDNAGLPHIVAGVPKDTMMGSPINIFERSGAAWTATEPFPDAPRAGFPAIGIDQAGNLHIAISSILSRTVLYRSRSSDGWSPETTVDSTDYWTTPLVLDAAGRAYIAKFEEGSTTLSLLTHSGQAWTKTTVDDDSSVAHDRLSTVVDLYGRLHLVYYDRAHDTLKHAWRSLAKPKPAKKI